MNEEKEDLRRQVERLQGQITNLTNQVRDVYCIHSLGTLLSTPVKLHVNANIELAIHMAQLSVFQHVDIFKMSC